MGGMVIWMHRANIQRIREGKEYRFGSRHKAVTGTKITAHPSGRACLRDALFCVEGAVPGRCACTVQFTEKSLQKRLTKGGAAGIITHVAGHKLNMWGISSAGRALAWHARGQRFDPAILHQKSTVLRRKYGAFLFLSRKMGLALPCPASFSDVLQAVQCSPRVIGASAGQKVPVQLTISSI